MTAPRLLRGRAVAARLGIAPATFYKRWHRLVAEHRFPPPVAGLGKFWDSRAVEAWLDAQLPTAEAEAIKREGTLYERWLREGVTPPPGAE